MHEHVISFQQNPTQNFWQNHKNPKNFLNLKPRSQKCMKKWEKERLRALTYEIELGLGRKWRGKKDFGEKRVFGLREKRERSRYLILHKIGSDLKEYIENLTR